MRFASLQWTFRFRERNARWAGPLIDRMSGGNNAPEGARVMPGTPFVVLGRLRCASIRLEISVDGGFRLWFGTPTASLGILAMGRKKPHMRCKVVAVFAVTT